ncbi:L-serine ammonia-lyase [Ancylobacter sonchi]|uniref:L-serine ammonia-lyase n=1 Tax=Ancylobacter sonchi TaxID=1937790 RepID=UPI001BD33578|nr:L-serine ammonia-lyase [Ancylobacter sonchi]MBS7534171.1 L-serine ammonia-lyase [Ancylobacter sonchi]
MVISVCDIFKIGIGPSSSHTVGPMVAAARFLDDIAARELSAPGGRVTALAASLHGSLAHTGIGHGSDRAIILGLDGHAPASVAPDDIGAIVARVAQSKHVVPAGRAYRFDPATDLVLDKKTPLPGHANGMRFHGFAEDGRRLLTRTYYSIGGGFVLSDSELAETKAGAPASDGPALPYPFRSAAQLLAMAKADGLSIAAMQRRNEEVTLARHTLDERLDGIWSAMSNCIDRGLSQGGIMPGGLKVRRRAAGLRERMEEEARRNHANPLMANDWLSVYAMAVNEENAGGGRVVTAPTNGAAGVIPAVLRYWLHFHVESTRGHVRDFLLTAAAIGSIIKTNASISGAEVGCQGEVGSAAAMAAAGLCAVMGGTPEQVENAAEIALEHHLGMTCDPIGGLVQIPCIERNALGAVKAVTAASLALKGDGSHFVPLDAAIATMRQTGLDMNEKYKETSLGGLAVNVVEC